MCKKRVEGDGLREVQEGRLGQRHQEVLVHPDTTQKKQTKSYKKEKLWTTRGHRQDDKAAKNHVAGANVQQIMVFSMYCMRQLLQKLKSVLLTIAKMSITLRQWEMVVTTGPGIPRRPSAPVFPGGPWGPTGPVFPTGPSAPASPCWTWQQNNTDPLFQIAKTAVFVDENPNVKCFYLPYLYGLCYNRSSSCRKLKQSWGTSVKKTHNLRRSRQKSLQHLIEGTKKSLSRVSPTP